MYAALLALAVHADAKGVAFFETKVRPVLVEHCYGCHSGKKTRGGLALDTREGVRAGGDTGPAVVPGQAEKSLLVKAVRHDGLKMPDAKKKLPDAVVADLAEWVAMGAPDPRDGKSLAKKGIDYDEGRKHWAYRPVKPVKGGIDELIAATHSEKGLTPAPEAPPHTLLRRLTFDLTGLPPTPEEQEAFEKNPNVADAVDRLLASPRFGEHWARHWLDGVRYNPQLPSVDHYRDWVVRALNADVPYDRFLVEQLAGDLLPPADAPEARDGRRAATQLLALNVREMDAVEGMVEVVGQQVLGISLNCAKCHDHKFDAFSQADYYALAGVFTSSRVAGAKIVKSDGVPLEAAKGVYLMTLVEGKTVGDTNLLIRGERGQRGPLVPRRFPVVLAGEGQTPLGKLTKHSGRLELARWITSPDNPLTARVLVNRLWMRMTGLRLVSTPNDFGTQAEPPTHPELLDHLAGRLVAAKWSVKAVLREIALSKAYRRASRAGRDADPDIVYFTRAAVRRLSYEQLHDALHALAGKLDAKPPARGAKAKPGKRGVLDDTPRALYLAPSQMAKLFDGPEPELLVERRDASVTAPQMLFFLNSPLVQQVASAVAGRCAKSPERAYRLLFGRAPDAQENERAAAFLKKHPFERYCHLLLCASEFLYLE